MDKNTITGILLIILLFVGFTWWNQPSEDEIKAQQEQIAKQKADKEKKSNNVEKTKKDQKISNPVSAGIPEVDPPSPVITWRS